MKKKELLESQIDVIRQEIENINEQIAMSRIRRRTRPG